MFKFVYVLLISWTLLIPATQAENCPDPLNSSLKWGEIPAPWLPNPQSEHSPQGDEHARFVSAKIMVAGVGKGIICEYSNTLGKYSIWRPTLVKIPARTDYQWIETLGGFICWDSFTECEFFSLPFL